MKLRLLLLLVLIGPLFAQTTTNYHFNVPPFNTTGWNNLINANFNSLDSILLTKSCIATATTLTSVCGATPGLVASITDGLTNLDCTAGGGTNKNICVYNGTIWTVISGSGSLTGCTDVAGVLTCPQFTTSGVNGGMIGTEGTCLGAGFTPATGVDLLCPSSLSGPLGTHGWIQNNNNGGWVGLPAPTLTPGDLQMTNGTAFAAAHLNDTGTVINASEPILGAVSGTTVGLGFVGFPTIGFYYKGSNAICATLGSTCGFWMGGANLFVVSGSAIGWSSSGTDASAGHVAGFSNEVAAGEVIGVGNGTQGDESATLRSANTQRVSGANYTNATTTPSSVFSWTALQTEVNKTWNFDCRMVWQGSAGTTTLNLYIASAQTPVNEAATATVYTTLAGTETDATVSSGASGNVQIITSAVPGATGTNYKAILTGGVELNAATASTFTILAAAGTTGTVTILRDASFCTLQ